jgi:hypothetical protein
LYASYISRFAIQNGFALSIKVLPWRVAPIDIAGQRHPFDPAPLQSFLLYYGRLRPCAPPWYSGSCRGYLLELLPSHRDDRFLRSSLKPESESRRLNAGCRWDSKQVPSNLVPEHVPSSGFDIVSDFRHVLSGSLAFVFLTHTWQTHGSAFSPTFTTMAFDLCSLRWFETSSCKPVPRDLPSSSVKHGFP